MNDDVLNLLTSQPRAIFNSSILNNFDTSLINYHQLNETKKQNRIPSSLNLNDLNSQKAVSTIDVNTLNSVDIEQKIKNLDKQAQLLQIEKDVSSSNEKLYTNGAFEFCERLTGSIFNAKPVIPQALNCESVLFKDNKLNINQNTLENYELLLENKKNVVSNNYLTNQEFLTNDFKMPNLSIIK